MEKRVERALGQRSDGDEVLAQPAAFADLTVERFGQVLGSDQFCLDEQIS